MHIDIAKLALEIQFEAQQLDSATGYRSDLPATPENYEACWKDLGERAQVLLALTNHLVARLDEVGGLPEPEPAPEGTDFNAEIPF